MSLSRFETLARLLTLDDHLQIIDEKPQCGWFCRILKPFSVWKAVSVKEDILQQQAVELLALPEELVFFPWLKWGRLGGKFYIRNGSWFKLRFSSLYYPLHDGVGRKQPIGHSLYNYSFLYRPDTMIFPSGRYNNKDFISCSTGIHAFLTFMEARYYDFT